jgi:general secretion pathway protein J
VSSLTSHPLCFKTFRQGERGFTLIEILVAISILAIVLSSIYGIFTSVSRARERLDADSADYHRARVVFDRLGRELRGAYFQRNNPDLVFAGGADSPSVLEFELTTTAVTPISQTGSGIANVRYLLTEDTEEDKDGLVLMRRERPVHQPASPNDTADMMRLVPGVEAMSLRFFNEGRWQTRWDGATSGLPELVEISLQLLGREDGGVRFVSAFDVPDVKPR